MMKIVLTWVLAFSCSMGLAQGPAGSYPNRPVRVLLTYPPGGASDTVVRILSPGMSERLGKPVVVENRPGANGVIAAEMVAKAPANGYTLLVAQTTAMGLNTVLFPNLPYDPQKELSPITLLVTSPFSISVNPSLMPVATIRDVIAMAKAKPGQLSYGSGGNLTGMHLAGEYFRILANVDLLHVPYKGNGPALSDLAAGQIPIAFTDLGSTAALAKSGRIKVLAISAKQRTPMAPEIPASEETGLPGWYAYGSFGLIAPAGTPVEIINRLNAEVTALLRLADVRERILATGNEPAPMSVEEYKAFINSETHKWVRVIKEAGIKLNDS